VLSFRNLGVNIVVFDRCQFRREQEEQIRLIQEALDRKAKEKAREQFLREQALKKWLLKLGRRRKN
jgi:hypothetical protein